ncbi:MAG TPA: hypothetical protein VEA60_06845 [Allosphingosinicella sp.]|nr:hypothetical protein [Allosphingosinicella sp.]
MTFAKAMTLAAAALFWLVVAVAVLMASFPLRGMSAAGPWPSWMIGAFILWSGAYVALAIWLIRLKKFP